ncbi:ATPase [Betaproteobacteria bacterium]|nr:ATPase [Betaproteobacteria bacterium]
MNTSAPALSFEKQLANLLRARFPCLYVATWEENRILNLIRAVAANKELIRTPRKVFEWSLTEGIVNGGKPAVEDTKAALKALEFIAACTEPAIFVLKDFHVFFGAHNRPPDIQIVRKIRDIIPGLKQSANPKNIIFVTPQLLLPDDLEKDISLVEFALPSVEEIRNNVLTPMIETNRHSGRIKINLTPEEEEQLAKAAQGLTLHEAENAFARAMIADGMLHIADLAIILEEKRQIIRKSGILEFIKSDLNIDDVGGLQNLKRWLVKRNKSWLDAAARYQLPAPKGVLITGVPGCGKSLLAKAVAALWQVPLLRLDIGKIFAGIVGSSEENMRRAIQTAEAISPCVLWIDEIEKGFGGISGPSGDSGTSTRIFATFLTWMQEKTRPVFVVATANNISALPPEMMRKGRFDEIFFVDLPTYSERREILKLHLKRRLRDPGVIGSFTLNEQALHHLAKLTEGFVGAELEQAVIGGLFEAFHEDRAIRLKDFEHAIRLTVPLSVTQAEQIHSLRQWANARAVAATPLEDRSDYATSDKPTTPIPTTADDIVASRGGRSIDF